MPRSIPVTKTQVKKALDRNGGNISATARDLGVTRVTVYDRINSSTELRYALGRQRFDRAMDGERLT
jgi:DNA-binding NtrC family response regulator